MVMLLLAGATGFSVLGCPSMSVADESCIMFLDDLFHPLDVDESRDPWEERIETDRHDFTQSPKTVGRGVGVIEMGYTYFYEDTGAEIEQSHVTPEMMLRVGLTEDIEFRVMWNYAWRTIDGEDEPTAVEGAEDLRWSFKLRTTEQAGLVPDSAIKIASTAPTGGHAWTTDRVEFGLLYIYEWKIADGWTLAGSSGLLTQALGDFGLLPEEPAAIDSWSGCSRWPWVSSSPSATRCTRNGMVSSPMRWPMSSPSASSMWVSTTTSPMTSSSTSASDGPERRIGQSLRGRGWRFPVLRWPP